MSEAVLIALIVAGATLLGLLMVVLFFGDRIQQISFSASDGSVSVMLSSAQKEAATESMAHALAMRGDADSAQSSEQLETRISSLENEIERTVLWVDDQPSNNRYEVSALQALGIDVLQATDNRQAYEYFKQKQIALVVTDIGRKNQATDGLDLVSTLSEQQAGVPVIVYTGIWGVENQGAEASGRGARAITASPVELTNLVLDLLK